MFGPSGAELRSKVKDLVERFKCPHADHAQTRALEILSSRQTGTESGLQDGAIEILDRISETLDGEKRLRLETLMRRINLAGKASFFHEHRRALKLLLQLKDKNVGRGASRRHGNRSASRVISPKLRDGSSSKHYTQSQPRKGVEQQHEQKKKHEQGGSQFAALAPPKLAESAPRPLVNYDHTYYGVGEDELVRELVFSLHGVDGNYVYADKYGSFVVDKDLCISLPARRVCEEVLLLATMHRKICGCMDKESPGLINQALRDVMQLELARHYYRDLASLEMRVGTAQLTMRRLLVWIIEPMNLLRTLWDIASSTVGMVGTPIISAVYTLGNLRPDETTMRILEHITLPFLRMIDAWMCEGSLKDDFDEFFVQCDPQVSLQDLWTKRYRMIDAKVPCNISETLAHKIFLCGKSLNFIRLCCQETDWLDLDVTTLRGHDCTTSITVLENRVNQAAERTNERLVHLLFSKYNLHQHLVTIRKYLLLGKGDFIAHLMSEVEHVLSKKADTIHKHTLLASLDRVIRQTSLPGHEDEEFIQRLDVKLMHTSKGEKGWDIFSLDYDVSGPLHIMFTAQSMHEYHRAFCFLWGIRRFLHILNKCFINQRALEYHQRSQPDQMRIDPDLLQQCQVLRAEMLHYILNVHSYVMFDGLEMSWRTFEARLKACLDLDQMRELHDVFLKEVSHGCFLSPPLATVLEQMKTLFVLVDCFVQTNDNLTNRIYSVTPIEQPDEDDEYTFPLQIAEEFEPEIEELNRRFTSGVKRLCEMLQKNGKLTLSERLDFNQFYKSERIAAPDSFDF